MSSNRGKLPGAGGQDSPDDRTPPAEALQASERQQLESNILDEFSRWLERWAGYAQARAALALARSESMPAAQAAAGDEENSSVQSFPPLPGRSLTPQGPPAHWQAAATQGPPAHWLALFSGQHSDPTIGEQSAELPEIPPASQPREPAGSAAEVIRRFQTDLADFLSASSPEAAQAERHQPFPSSTGITIRAAGSDDLGVYPGSPAAPLPAQPGLLAHREEPLPDAQQALPAASPPNVPPSSPPTARLGAARMTQFHLRLPPARSPSTAIRSPGLASESPAGSPAANLIQPERSPEKTPSLSAVPEYPTAQPRVTRLHLGSLARVRRAGHTTPITALEPAPPPALPAESNTLSALAHEPAPLPTQPAAEPAPGVQPQSEPGKLAPPALSTPPEDVRSPSPAAEATAPVPEFPASPLHAEPLPVRWPANTNLPYWPDLPEPLPPHNPGPSPYQDPARRRRIDREQGGSLWNG